MPVSLTSNNAALEADPISPPPLPLCVDLDGTLVISDLLHESLLLLCKRNPLYLLLVISWLWRGRAYMKAQICMRVMLSAEGLPYNRALMGWIQTERRTGRRVWLCTAANELLAARIAAHLGLFDGVLASDAEINLAGERKAARLVERFGERGFDYCGNERRDLAIWKRANGAIVVCASSALQRDAEKLAPVLKVFPRRMSRLRAIAKALRPHQWAKNVLILIPLLAAHRAADTLSLIASLKAAATFCLCASSAYVVNDLLDLQADRHHARKQIRPLAAGDLSIRTGLLIAPLLFAAAISIATTLPLSFGCVLGGYYALTIAYSFGLKGLVLVDAIALAGLYTLRIIAGAAAINVALSFWLLLFSVFLFLSLAFVKRFAELDMLRRQQRLKAMGRGYTVEDLPVLQSLGSAAGYLSVVVLALYINSPEIRVLYHRPQVIWILCVLMLYWISRVWMTAQRGAMHDDPVIFALKDRVSLCIGLATAITVLLAL